MVVYIDTSAFYAILYQKDENNTAASKIWTDLITRGETLVSNNFESMRRLGIQRAFAFDHHYNEQGFETLS